MTFNPTPPDPRETGSRDLGRSSTWGAVGLFIVGLVAALAVIATLLGPTDTQQASNAPTSPPAGSQSAPPTTAQ
jgi:hypothetical protein